MLTVLSIAKRTTVPQADASACHPFSLDSAGKLSWARLGFGHLADGSLSDSALKGFPHSELFSDVEGKL